MEGAIGLQTQRLQLGTAKGQQWRGRGAADSSCDMVASTQAGGEFQRDLSEASLCPSGET